MLDVYVYIGPRMPFGRHTGVLSTMCPGDLTGLLLACLVEASGSVVNDLRGVTLGRTDQAGEDSRSLVRNTLFTAGLLARLPGQMVNRLYVSGLSAMTNTARTIGCGEGRSYLAGGVKSMSQTLLVMAKMGNAFSRMLEVFDSTIGTRFVNPKLVERHGNGNMPGAGNNVARAFGITREDTDRFAVSSQARYQITLEEGFFLGETLPVEARTGRKGETRLVERDEHPRPQTNLVVPVHLLTLLADGVMIVSNTSGTNDGAAVVLLGDRAIGECEDVRPLARILASTGVDAEPRLMGIGSQRAILHILQRAGINLDEVSLIEIGEAFMPQVLACLRSLGLDYEDPWVGPHGSATALDHPLGTFGARLVFTATRGLQHVEWYYTVVSLCTGFSQGVAMATECYR